jgi:hypothetical protein
MSYKHINSGVLEIRSAQASGKIGIAWGRFITGAILDNGEQGKKALRRLLSLRGGRFTFHDTEEPVFELRQSLGIDLNGVAFYIPHFGPNVTPSLFDPGEEADFRPTNSKARPALEDPVGQTSSPVKKSAAIAATTVPAPQTTPNVPGYAYHFDINPFNSCPHCKYRNRCNLDCHRDHVPIGWFASRFSGVRVLAKRTARPVNKSNSTNRGSFACSALTSVVGSVFVNTDPPGFVARSCTRKAVYSADARGEYSSHGGIRLLLRTR